MAGYASINVLLSSLCKLKIVYIVILLNITLTNAKSNFLSDIYTTTDTNTTTSKFSIAHPIESVFTTELAKYFLNFAAFGYCTIKEMEERTCCQDILDQEGWEVIEKETINFDNYNFAILKHDEYKKIIMTFPGTRGKYQFIQEVLQSNGVPLDGDKKEKIMNYFKQVWVLIKSIIGEKLKTLYSKYPEYQYIFTGHSLGAAIATIAALDSVKYENLKRTENSPVLITYGQPRTGNDIFANQVMNHIPIIYRVVRQGDFIATYPKCVYDKILNVCMGNLPESKFIRDLPLTPEQIEAEEANYYSWHLGGMMLYDNPMENYSDCSLDYGDNNPNKECALTVSVNFYRHLIYFDKFISKMCRKRWPWSRG